MLLKGLVYQTMPQLTMVQAIASELRKKFKGDNVKLSDVRDYLKGEIAIEKGNLKIGRLIVDEIGRQAACHARRTEARHINPSSVSMNAKVARARGKGESLNLTEKRRNHLADEMFSPLVGLIIADRKIESVAHDDTSPTFRVSAIGRSYYDKWIAHQTRWTPTAVHYVVAEKSRRDGKVHELVLTAVGLATVRGHAVAFDRQTCLFTVNGESMSPIHLGERFMGWKLHEIVVKREPIQLP